MPGPLVELSRLLHVSPEALAAVLPGPVGDMGEEINRAEMVPVRWFGVGHPLLLVVGVADGSVLVGVPALRWISQRPVTELASYVSLPLSGSDMLSRLAEQVGTASTARLATFRTCHRCDAKQPPEWMLDDDRCQACAEADGVVF